jgi:hypothetical protein
VLCGAGNFRATLTQVAQQLLPNQQKLLFTQLPRLPSPTFFSPNSSTRASSGVMVAHLMPTPHS